MVSAETKTERLVALEQLVLAHPEGISRKELASRLRVNRSTVTRYVAELSLRIPLYEGEDKLLRINTDRYLNRISLTVHEIMSLYLATVLMADNLDRRNLHAASALRKLGSALERLSPSLCSCIRREADILDGPSQRDDETFIRVLERLTQAWTGSRKVRIVYFSHHRDETSEYVFSPWVILPYSDGHTLHAVGLCNVETEPRVFRVDRIRSATLLTETYAVPHDFNPTEFFRYAWGIWRQGGQPSRVVIRFSPAAAFRLKETVWHGTQIIEDLPDGGALFHTTIEEPTEMLHWIRGWGSDAEVLEPASLRETLTEEAEKLADIYGIYESGADLYG